MDNMRNEFVIGCSWCPSELGLDDIHDGLHVYLPSVNGVRMYFCDDYCQRCWIVSRVEGGLKDALYVLAPNIRDIIINDISNYVTKKRHVA